MASKRTLFIVRHAKSSWDIEGVSDLDRPLKQRGIRSAYEMARRLKIERLTPDLLIASPANRAMHTAAIFMRVFEFKYQKLKLDERLYATGVGAIKKLISEQADNVKKLMIFGHNPDLSDLATSLSKGEYIELPTCGICRLTFQLDSWKELSPDLVVNSVVDFPRNSVELE